LALDAIDDFGRQGTRGGFSAAEVQRLIITVGVLVFVTAACFFSGGVVVGGAAIAALNKPVASSPAKADVMESKLQEMSNLPPGESFALSFTEDEISSYFRFKVAPQIGINDGKIRLLDEPGQFVLGGQWQALGNLRVAATFRLEAGDKPMQLESAAVQVLDVGNSTFGWVAVPTPLLQPLTDQINGMITSRAQVEKVTPKWNGAWTVSGVKQ
jgi:hypothetical protein